LREHRDRADRSQDRVLASYVVRYLASAKKTRRVDRLIQIDSRPGPCIGRGSTKVETTLAHVSRRMTSPRTIPSHRGIT